MVKCLYEYVVICPLQMVSIRRLPGPKNPAEMTYYAQLNGAPITGTNAAKTLSSLDSQTMALTLGYFVQVQAERKPVILQSYNYTSMLCSCIHWMSDVRQYNTKTQRA